MNNKQVDIPNFHTERLLIKPYSFADGKLCYELYSSEKLMRYFDFGKTFTKEDFETFITTKGTYLFKQNLPFGLYCIFNRSNQDFIGVFDFMPTDNLNEAEIGCIISKKHQNKGYAVEAMTFLLIKMVPQLNVRFFGETRENIKRIIATAHPKNYASQKLIKSIGMKFNRIGPRFQNQRLYYSFDIIPN